MRLLRLARRDDRGPRPVKSRLGTPLPHKSATLYGRGYHLHSAVRSYTSGIFTCCSPHLSHTKILFEICALSQPVPISPLASIHSPHTVHHCLRTQHLPIATPTSLSPARQRSTNTRSLRMSQKGKRQKSHSFGQEVERLMSIFMRHNRQDSDTTDEDAIQKQKEVEEYVNERYRSIRRGARRARTRFRL